VRWAGLNCTGVLIPNMMLCDKSVAHTVAESRCDSVFVSLDGPREIHNRLRGKPHALINA